MSKNMITQYRLLHTLLQFRGTEIETFTVTENIKCHLSILSQSTVKDSLWLPKYIRTMCIRKYVLKSSDVISWQTFKPQTQVQELLWSNILKTNVV